MLSFRKFARTLTLVIPDRGPMQPFSGDVVTACELDHTACPRIVLD